MRLKEIINKAVWEGFLSECQEKTFLQSWNWGEFQKMEGNKIWRWGIYKENSKFKSQNAKLVAAALVVKIEAKRGTFLFIPHGPIIKNQKLKLETLQVFLSELKKLAQEEKASFIRIAPVWDRTEENIKIFRDLNFRKAPIHMHPELSWELDISFSEEDLLMKMRKTTRYLIRRAIKNEEIEVVKSKNINDVEIFNQIYQETAKRHRFVPFSLKYLKNEFSVFNKDNQSLILLGKYREEPIASAIIIYWQDCGYYHQGASLSKYDSNKIPVSYLLQWEAIKEAKKRGCQRYNFWGITPLKEKNQENKTEEEKSKKIADFLDKSHPWYGLSLFKIGFGGNLKEYVETQDFPLSKRYYFTYLVEKIRKRKRGL